MKRIELSGIDELINFLIEGLANHFNGDNAEVILEGEKIEVEGLVPIGEDYFYGDYIFTLSEDNVLYIRRLEDKIDQTLVCKLPSYIREQLIATLKGEW